MRKTAAQHLADVVIAYGVGAYGLQASGWSIFLQDMPDEPDAIITFRDTGGLAPNPKFLLDRPAVQVRLRGTRTGYDAAQTQMAQIKDILLGLTPQDMPNGDRISGVLGLGDIAFMKFDQKRRPEFVTNYRLFLEPATNADTNRISL